MCFNRTWTVNLSSIHFRSYWFYFILDNWYKMAVSILLSLHCFISCACTLQLLLCKWGELYFDKQWPPCAHRLFVYMTKGFLLTAWPYAQCNRVLWTPRTTAYQIVGVCSNNSQEQFLLDVLISLYNVVSPSTFL